VTKVFDAVNVTQAMQASSGSVTLALQGYHSDASHAGMQLVLDIFTADGSKQTVGTGNASAWKSNNADNYFNPSKQTTSKDYGQPLENINEQYAVPGEHQDSRGHALSQLFEGCPMGAPLKHPLLLN
jgi:hypothetical protein